MNPDWRRRYEAAIAAAEHAGKLALQYYPGADVAAFRKNIELKGDQSPVTIADRSAEEYLRNTLLGAFPNDGFLGEEFGERSGDSGYRWIIDPVDGTHNFIRGIPMWGTLVGLEYKGETIAGIVGIPPLGHWYRALRGDGAYRNDQRIHVSAVSQMNEAQLFYSSLSWFEAVDRHEDFLNLARQTRRQRGFGDCYGYVLVAQGSGEIMIEHGIHIWDVAAVKPLIEEAGGRMTDWEGQPRIDKPDSIATNGILHDEALRLMNARGR